MSYGTSPEQVSAEVTVKHAPPAAARIRTVAAGVADAQMVERMRRLVAEFYRINPHLPPIPVTVVSRRPSS